MSPLGNGALSHCLLPAPISFLIGHTRRANGWNQIERRATIPWGVVVVVGVVCLNQHREDGDELERTKQLQ